jgi:hypothetical protein
MDQEKRTLDFLRLFVRHQHEIYAYILTLVPQVHDADDLTHVLSGGANQGIDLGTGLFPGPFRWSLPGAGRHKIGGFCCDPHVALRQGSAYPSLWPR